MAIKRNWQTGNEVQNVNSEYDSVLTSGAGTVSISTALSKTGSACMRCVGSTGASNSASGRRVVDTYAIRTGFHVYVHPSAGVIGEQRIFSIRSGSTVLVYLKVSSDGFTITAYSNATSLGTYSVLIDTWFHVGFDVFIDGSSGWVNCYIDGTLLGSFSGNTGTDKPTEVLYGTYPQLSSTLGSNIYIAYDDEYIDDSTGELAPAPIEDIRFNYRVLTGDGTYSQFSTYTGSVHYALLDEVPPIATDYVYSSTPGQRDSYQFSDYSLSNGASIEALIPIAVARKESEVDTQIGLGIGLSGTFILDSFNSLPTSYGIIKFGRFSTNEFGDAWTENDINNSEILIMSSGTYT